MGPQRAQYLGEPMAATITSTHFQGDPIMSRRIHRLACLVLLVQAGAAYAQIPEPDTQMPVTKTVLRFHNGSVIQPSVLLDDLEIETKIGKLRIPANEVQRIDFGFRLSPEETKQLERALNDLDSDNYQAREMSKKTLITMGRLAYPALLATAKTGNLETTKRVDLILKEIRSHNSPERLQSRRTDIIRTSDSAVAGIIITPNLRIRCELFGEVTIPVMQLRELRSLLPNEETNVAVDASKYGNQTWMETEVEIAPGNRLDITATGEINLDPVGGIGNPALTRNVRPDGTRQLNANEPYAPGQLLGRIGTDGQTFVIGSRYIGFPDREGRLFLRIVTLELSNNVRADGSFQVRISSQPN